jgi:Arc/MetJ-type ribon-helix-helix transcriptional regulator
MTTRVKPIRRQRVGKGKLLAAYVPESLVEAIDTWVADDEERSTSQFVRAATREKLKRAGIKFSERKAA